MTLTEEIYKLKKNFESLYGHAPNRVVLNNDELEKLRRVYGYSADLSSILGLAVEVLEGYVMYVYYKYPKIASTNEGYSESYPYVIKQSQNTFWEDPRCECGSEIANIAGHSSWCPKRED